MSWTPPRLIGYVRTSTNDQPNSPAVQRDAIAKLAATAGGEVVAVYDDIGRSGALGPDRRPGLARALDHVRRLGKGALLVAWKRDRLARGDVAGWVAHELARGGARILTEDGGDLDDSPGARLTRACLDAAAEYERAMAAVRTKAALAQVRRRGVRLGAVPYGMRRADEPDGSGHRPLLPDARERAAIEKMRKLRRRGLTLAAIAARLDADGVRPRRGARWSAVVVHRILGRALRPSGRARAATPR